MYPTEFFCPLNYSTGKLTITSNTVAIHHYSASWHTKLDDIVVEIERCDLQKNRLEYRIRRLISFPFRAVNRIKKNGIRNTADHIIKKFT